MSERVGSFIICSSGTYFWPLDPRPEEVLLIDICHALSQVIRWSGHAPAQQSVAEHCIMVSERVAELGGSVREQFIGLMHDASEAYVADLARPIKKHFPEYRAIEDKLQLVIGQRFGLGDQLAKLPAVVKHADDDMLLADARTYFPNADWHKEWKFHEPVPTAANWNSFRRMAPMTWPNAKAAFKDKFIELASQVREVTW